MRDNRASCRDFLSKATPPDPGGVEEEGDEAEGDDADAHA
jgi:hypothetical protein